MDKEELKNRIKNTIVLLGEGHHIQVGNLTLSSKGKSLLTVEGWTNNNYLENVTKQSALAELKDIKDLFLKMVDASSDLADFIQKKQIEYSLGYDYGMGSIAICRDKDEKIFWETDLKE